MHRILNQTNVPPADV